MEKTTTITGRIHQDKSFTATEFSGALLEGLIGMEDSEDREPLLVFIKIKDQNWHRFFLDSAIGFWENWQETEVDQSEAHLDEVVYVDYRAKYSLENKQIADIVCLDSQIIITFINKAQFILKEVNPGAVDTPSAVIFIP
ncbi:hypothetical protein [Flavobacterium sp. JP2137]|uniref:hypothetical protein n=1 Tax=Flavobacterium sp. JP2137 TaxID=3414510 RepID=UPI003D2FC418